MRQADISQVTDDQCAYHLDIDGLNPSPAEQAARRPWLGILFDCCRVYARVYRSPDGRFYRGRCPKCLRQVRLRVGPEGTAERFFRAH